MSKGQNHRRIASDPFEFDEPLFSFEDGVAEQMSIDACCESDPIPAGLGAALPPAQLGDDVNCKWPSVATWKLGTPPTHASGWADAGGQDLADWSDMDLLSGDMPDVVMESGPLPAEGHACAGLDMPDHGVRHASSTEFATDILSNATDAPIIEKGSAGTDGFFSNKRARKACPGESQPQSRGAKLGRVENVVQAIPNAKDSELMSSVDTSKPPPLMEKPLPPEIAYRMLTDPDFSPGIRPCTFDPRDGTWVFKEIGVGNPATRSARSRGDGSLDVADRWHNSGGVRGARDMPTKAPCVRRRYGSIARKGKILFRFHEYSLLRRVDDASQPSGVRYEEDRSTSVFHVMPKRVGKGRPSKAEAALPNQLWQAFVFGA